MEAFCGSVPSPVGPVRVGGVESEESGLQHEGGRCQCHRGAGMTGAGMTGAGLLHGIHGEGTDGVDGPLGDGAWLVRQRHVWKALPSVGLGRWAALASGKLSPGRGRPHRSRPLTSRSGWGRQSLPELQIQIVR